MMRRLARFDLNLLQVFDAIHAKGGVSAKKLAQRVQRLRRGP